MIDEERLETPFTLAKKKKLQKEFLASIPLSWVCRASRLPGKSLQVALAIRHQARLERRDTVSFGNSLLNRMGVNGDAKRRALSCLEQEGLIRITRELGKKPRVTIIEETE